MCHLATKCSKESNFQNYLTLDKANRVDNASGSLRSQWHSVQMKSTRSGIEVAQVADCQLSSEEGHRQLHSADSGTCVIIRQHWGLMFHGCPP